ncbi:MAG: hypothetical protein J6W06_12430, partial [Bacteroidales bacterium]|nr:hypothetical protein [Bacteroidales bacterium]
MPSPTDGNNICSEETTCGFSQCLFKNYDLVDWNGIRRVLFHNPVGYVLLFLRECHTNFHD